MDYTLINRTLAAWRVQTARANAGLPNSVKYKLPYKEELDVSSTN